MKMMMMMMMMMMMNSSFFHQEMKIGRRHYSGRTKIIFLCNFETVSSPSFSGSTEIYPMLKLAVTCLLMRACKVITSIPLHNRLSFPSCQTSGDQTRFTARLIIFLNPVVLNTFGTKRA